MTALDEIEASILLTSPAHAGGEGHN